MTDDARLNEALNVCTDAAGQLRALVRDLPNLGSRKAIADAVAPIIQALEAASTPNIGKRGRTTVSGAAGPTRESQGEAEHFTPPPSRPSRQSGAAAAQSNRPKPSAEQQLAIDHARANDITKIEAKAGSGKTTLLSAIAEALPGRGVYMAYNKEIQRDSAGKFPSRVLTRTGHSLAYAVEGAALQDRGKRIDNLRVAHVAQLLDLQGSDAMTDAYGAKVTLEAFLNTTDERVTTAHVPPSFEGRLIRKLRGQGLGQDAAALHCIEISNKIVRHAQNLWDLCLSANSAAPMPHDGYLKLWHQNGANIDCDFLLVDEFQDMTPVMNAIVRSQQTRLVCVGDRWQSIYGYRGAINALEQIQGEALHLTQSFRFGQPIADEANSVLKLLGETKLIQGVAKGPSRVGTIDRNKPFAVLARTNAHLCLQAARYAGKLPLAVVGDPNDLVKLLRSAHALYVGKQGDITHELLRPWANKTYQDFADYVESSNDPEAKVVRKVIDEHGAGLADAVSALAAGLVPEASARVVLSTAHRSKGREFDQVVIADDFPELFDREGGLKAEEARLRYVALTRAKQVLEASPAQAQAMKGSPGLLKPPSYRVAKPERPRHRY